MNRYRVGFVAVYLYVRPTASLPRVRHQINLVSIILLRNRRDCFVDLSRRDHLFKMRKVTHIAYRGGVLYVFDDRVVSWSLQIETLGKYFEVLFGVTRVEVFVSFRMRSGADCG